MNEFLQAVLAEDHAHQLTAETALLHLLVAFLLGQLIAWVYVFTHRGLSYSRAQVQSLILLALIVTTVMLAVGNNLARAFGLFGALSLVRFRTPIKDARDTAFLFMSVGVGIGAGTQNLVIAVVGTGVMCAVAVYLHWTRFGAQFTHDALLRFTLPSAPDGEARLREILTRYCRHFALVHMREPGPGAPLEYSYQITLRDPQGQSALLGALQQLDQLSGLSLLAQDDEAEI